MILLDYSAVGIANIMRAIKKDGEILTEGFALHMILNSIRRANKMFRKEFGTMVVCCDNRSNWRDWAFDFYKWKRKNDKKDSDIDWDLVYACLDYTKKELEIGFPYLVLEEYNAEADDIIGALARYSTDNQKPTVVVSNDKDFIGSHSEFVCQYRPVEQAFVRNENPKRFLKELIIRGDSDDGVPNIKSQDDIFTIDGKRQRSIFQKELDIWLDDEYNTFLEELDIKFKKVYEKELKKDKKAVKVVPSVNFVRNTKLIDLTNTPDEIVDNVILKFQKGRQRANKPKMTKFFMKHKLRYLHEKMNDFI